MSKKSPPSNVVAIARKPAAAANKAPRKPALQPVPEAPREVKAALVAAAKPAVKPTAKKQAAKSVRKVSTVATNDAPAAKAKVAKAPAVKTAAAKAPAAKAAPVKKSKAASPASVPVAAMPVAKSASRLAEKAPATEIPESAKPPKAGSKLAKQLAARASAPVRIFQIYYESWQRELLDPAFIGLNNAGVKTETLEFDVFERLSASEHVKGATLWGALSWRFAEKTGMSGSDLMKAIASRPGMDVYYSNPHPHIEALFHNMWTQGETTHPQFLALSQAVFQAAGLPLEELSAIAPSGSFSSANYFVGSPAFWTRYLAFVRKVLSTAEKKLSPDARKLLHSAMADDRGLHRGATYVPFIVERLFPVFMKTEGRELKAFKVTLPEREREMNVHLKLLREMKDVAHKTKSPWLAACWVNYRNLYFTQVNGKAWCQKYLRSITPTEIKFA